MIPDRIIWTASGLKCERELPHENRDSAFAYPRDLRNAPNAKVALGAVGTLCGTYTQAGVLSGTPGLPVHIIREVTSNHVRPLISATASASRTTDCAPGSPLIGAQIDGGF